MRAFNTSIDQRNYQRIFAMQGFMSILKRKVDYELQKGFLKLQSNNTFD